ncbi:acyltransferase family protein [Burkholderia multivorans]|uniref:acyltransferase family protein n=1 Tax=Burkholderia multivorans TaxID=87883 RepID=UPI00286FD035|nr:acyltransferase [Burkholderia multivorans]
MKKSPTIRKLTYPAIDGVRFFAAFIVFIDHLVSLYWTEALHRTHDQLIEHTGSVWTYLADGDHGVEIFFVISGFLMTRIVYGRKHFSYVGFIGARLKRIYPALAASVIFGIAARCLLVNWPFQPAQALANLLLLNTFPELNIMPYIVVTWSIGVELMFYLIIPALLLGRRMVGRRVAAIALSLLATALLWNAGSPYGRMIGLFAGSVIGAFDDVQLQRLAARLPLAALVLGYLGCGIAKWLTPMSYDLWRTIFLPVTTLLFVKIVWGEGNVANRLFSARPIRFLGTISYSFYLLHATVAYVVVSRFMPAWAETFRFFWYVSATTCLSLALSYSSYMLIERRYFRNKSVPPPQPGAVVQ